MTPSFQLATADKNEKMQKRPQDTFQKKGNSLVPNPQKQSTP